MTPAVRAFVAQLLVRLSSLETRLETSQKRLEASERRVAELEKEKENRQLRLGWAELRQLVNATVQ